MSGLSHGTEYAFLVRNNSTFDKQPKRPINTRQPHYKAWHCAGTLKIVDGMHSEGGCEGGEECQSRRSNNPSKNWGDAWYSKDGKTWTEYKTSTTWKARHEHSAYVLGGKLWIAGGHARPLSSEVWSLELPDGWPASR